MDGRMYKKIALCSLTLILVLSINAATRRAATTALETASKATRAVKPQTPKRPLNAEQQWLSNFTPKSVNTLQPKDLNRLAIDAAFIKAAKENAGDLTTIAQRVKEAEQAAELEEIYREELIKKYKENRRENNEKIAEFIKHYHAQQELSELEKAEVEKLEYATKLNKLEEIYLEIELEKMKEQQAKLEREQKAQEQPTTWQSVRNWFNSW